MVGLLRSHSDLSRRSFERILLIKPSSLGDVVHALPVLHGLRRRFPEAKIDWLLATPLRPLLEGHPDLDEVVAFDRRRYGRLGRSAYVAADFVRFVRGLRSRRYDLVIDLQGLFRSGFLAWATGALVRIGFRDAREGAPLFYTHHLRVDDPDVHAVDRNYAVAGWLGFADAPIKFRLDIPLAARAAATELLAQHDVYGIADCRLPITDCRLPIGNRQLAIRLIAVVPGARWETKRWAPERFAAVIDALQNDAGTHCVLLGSPEEVALCDRIAQACQRAPIQLAGRTEVSVLAAVIALSDLVLCQDSAAMHLAVALERPLVCLVGPTNPHRTGPYHRMGDVVRLELDCAPCYFRRLAQCPYDHRCMKELSVPTVITAVKRALTEPNLQRV